MAKNNSTGKGMLKEALGIIAVLAGTGLVLLMVYLFSHCEKQEKVPDPHSGKLESSFILDEKTGIEYVRCPSGIGANTLQYVYLTLGANSNSTGIEFYNIVFEDPEKYISEPKDALGGAFVYRSTDTEEITLEGFDPVSAGIFMGSLAKSIDDFYSEKMAKENNLENGYPYVKAIYDALTTQEETTPTGVYDDENEFYIRLYSEKYPGLYYEVLFYTDVNEVAYLIDMVTGKTIACPDIITARMIG